MYTHELTDNRSSELLQKISNRIDLGDKYIFTNNLIEIPYRINGKQKAICLSAPADIAAFAKHNHLITRYEKKGKAFKLYDVQILPFTDRRGYPYQGVCEVEIKRIPTLFTRAEIKEFVARYEYDYGDINDFYTDLFAPKGVVREMFPTGSNNNNNTKRIA